MLSFMVVGSVKPLFTLERHFLELTVVGNCKSECSVSSYLLLILLT
jgi:hypothetical protein